MKQLLRLWVLVIGSFLAAHAQPASPSNLRQVISPSPTAASLGVYGEVGVGYFTGLPDISVPLYEVRERGISLPIALHYNASGTRIAENASWVGLGWSLAAGGVITRTVRGLDDFKDNGDAGTGYYKASALPAQLNYTSPDKPTTSYDKLYFNGVKGGAYDVEPDIFTYNFGSYSGKFVLGKQQDGSKTLIDEQNNLQVEYSVSGWRITDAKGYQYLFADEEVTSSYTYFSNSAEARDDIALADLSYQPDKASITTAWYLSSITAPTGEIVRFTYSRGESLSLLNKSEDQYDLLELKGGCEGSGFASSHMKGRYAMYTASKQVITDRYLQKITFSQGTVEFSTTAREDIEARNPTLKPAKLAEVVVKNVAGEVLRSFQFSYSYFGTDGLQRRLKLDSLTEVGQGGMRKPPHKFAYYPGDVLFYNKYSKNIDYWGYYNGSANTRLLPQLVVQDYQRFLEGADRQPDQGQVYAKQGVLQAITYPTGGRTVFDYELHDYGNIKTQVKEVPHSIVVRTYPGNSLQRSEEFSLTEPTAVTASYGFNEANCAADGCQLRSTYTGLFFIDKIDAPATSILAVNNEFVSPTAQPPYHTRESGVRTLVLGPGRYRASVWYVPGYSISLSVSWKESQPDTTVTGRKLSGLRIKNITNYDRDRVVKQRTFKYTTKVGSKFVSSGVLLSSPDFSLRVSQTEDKGFIDKVTGSAAAQCHYEALYMGRLSSLIHPLGLSTRATVGYEKVTEILGTQGEGGRTEYTYFCKPDILPAFPTLPAQGYPLNGKLLQRMTYAASGELVEEETSTYEVKSVAGILGVKIFVSPAQQDAAWSSTNGGPVSIVDLGGLESPFFSHSYFNPSYWVTLSTQTQTSYQAKQAFTNTKTFTYANPVHKEVTQEQLTTSAGGTRITYRLYPADYSNATGFIGAMKAAHITGMPIEQVSCQLATLSAQPTVLAANLTTYSNAGLLDRQWQWEAASPVPLASFKFTNQALAGQSPTSGSPVEFTLTGKDAHYPASYQLRLTYDAYGQQQQVQQASGLPTSYLWSYAHMLPVAQIQNASATQVQLLLSNLGFGVNNLPTDEVALRRLCAQLRQRLPQAYITGFTHRPLIGLTSQTDPAGRTTFYEYDGLGRLLRTRDEQGRILSQQQYHYAGK
jgi:YD repeat-containing protein